MFLSPLFLPQLPQISLEPADNWSAKLLASTTQWPCHFTGTICSTLVTCSSAHPVPMFSTAAISVFLCEKRRCGTLSASVSSNNQIKAKDVTSYFISIIMRSTCFGH